MAQNCRPSSTAKPGKWFCHEDMKLPRDVNPTTTGDMMETPFHTNVAIQCIQPKTAMNFKSSNVFSERDNKRIFNTDSEYFSYTHNNRTLGRRNYEADKSLHHTDANFLHHQTHIYPNPGILPTMITTYGISYQRNQNTDQVLYRRFPKVYPDARTGPLEPSMSASHWFKEPDAYKASTQTLVDSLSPYIKYNPWKLSYHTLSKVYPN